MNKSSLEKIEKFYFKHKRVFTLMGVLIVTSIVLLDRFVFNGRVEKVGLYVNLFSALIIFTFMSVIAGYAVIQSLFLLGAELTLIIFLAQSYCAIPSRTEPGNKSLEILIVFGMFYILLKFGKTLYLRLCEFSDSLPKNDKIWAGIILVLFLILVGFFLYALYEVVSPIFTNLCIYQSS